MKSKAAADGTTPAVDSYYGEYDDNGVDVSLLRYMLGLSPLQRLKVMEKSARDTRILHECGRKHREANPPQDR